ncbi:hypothetical protein TWF192_011093 [Orbilia oligospora]|uniref:PDZ domain-containing protein n=1 Tax=Orbilia oligospora TaxID=2813651 RepID=A0A6G1MIM3_ORBOL|nr:hypothetical protein TWF191_003578 [Orbilia oligospora]KAF3258959.1 hypothetical protein TWF192_011093 [Orbilia oligospora]
MSVKEHWLWLLVWGLLLQTTYCQQHRGYFLLRVVSANNPNGPFKASNSFLITAPTTPSHPLTIRQNPTTTCPTKSEAIYPPSSIWLADWRIPATSSLTPSSTSTSAFSFFTRAKMVMEDVKTPLLRSLSGKTRSLVFGYFGADEGSAKEGRVGLLEVPDGSRSSEGFREGDTVVDVDGLGSAESIRFLHDPIDSSAGSPNIRANLTPPMSGSWVTGTLDPSIKEVKAYFTACEPTTANAGTYHLFRAGIPKLRRSENFFELFYSSCEDVYIHAERVADDSICFRWDMGRERDVREKRLFTLYHNSIAPSIPIVITPEVDNPPQPTSVNPDTISNININSNFNNNQVPNMKNHYIPVTRMASQASNPIERTISSITAVEDLLTEEDGNDITSFADGLKDFMGAGRGTPAFGSTENSDSGGSREGMELPDEVNILPAIGNMVTPGVLSNRISLDQRGGVRDKLTVPVANVDKVSRRESIQVSDPYNRLYPYLPFFDASQQPRSQQLATQQSQQVDNSQGQGEGSGTSGNLVRSRPQAVVTSNPLLSMQRGKGSLPLLIEPKGPGLIELREGERKRESSVLPGIVGSRSGTSLALETGTRRASRGYQNILGLNINALLPNIKGNTEKLTDIGGGVKMLPLAEVEDDDAVVETPGFPTTRKPAVRGSPMDMYITSDSLGFPVVMDSSSRQATEKSGIIGLNAGEWGTSKKKGGYMDMGSVPEGLKRRLGNRGNSIPASPRGSIPGTPKGLRKTINFGAQGNQGANSANNSPKTRSPSPQKNSIGSRRTNTRRPGTPPSISPRSKDTGKRSPSSPAITATDVNVKTGNRYNEKRRIREKVEVDHTKIIEDRKRKGTIPRFKSSKDFIKWLKENRPGDGTTPREGAKLAGATAATRVNTRNQLI